MATKFLSFFFACLKFLHLYANLFDSDDSLIIAHVSI